MSLITEDGIRTMGYRHGLMILGLLGLAICYIMRIAPGITIISMVKSPDRLDNSTDDKFDWTPLQENAILSSFYYTYFAVQLPAGLMAQRVGGKWTFAAGIAICGLICVILPPLVRFGGFTAFLLLRLCQGLAQGVCYPSLHRVVGHWFPPREYASLAGIMHSGYIAGTVLALLCSGYLIEAPFYGGWALPFYLSGILAFIWFPAWAFLVSETPRSHTLISAREKAYIEYSLKHTEHHRDDVTVPWIRIFTSPQVWLLMLCNLMDGWSNYTLLVCVPQYMDAVLHFPITTNGALSAIPYVAALAFMFLLTPVDSALINRGLLSISSTRKLWSGISAFGKAILLVIIAYTDPVHKTLIVVLLVVNVMLSSVMLLGFNLADLDLAPPFAGFLFAIFNACSTLSGMLAPLVVGAFTSVYPAAIAWRNVFVLASAVSFLCALLYVLFGRAEPLDWVVRDQGERPHVVYAPLDQFETNQDPESEDTLYEAEELPATPKTIIRLLNETA